MRSITAAVAAAGALTAGCAFQQSAGYGARLVEDGSEMATNVEYTSARCVQLDEWREPAVKLYARGGIVTLKVSRLGIGAAAADSFRVSVSENGRTLMSERGEPDVPSVCGERWCNVAVFFVPEPVESQLTVLVEDYAYRERRRFVFALSSAEPCE